MAAEGLADLALAEGRLADARTLLEPAIQADLAAKDGDGAARKLVMLAGVLRSLGQPARAAEAAERALKASQQDYVHLLAGSVLVEAGQERRALAVAEGLGRRLEPAPRLYAELLHGAVALSRKNPGEAVARFKAGQKLLDSWLVRYALGRAYLEAGAWPQAADELEACVRRRGEVTDVFIDNVPTYRLLGPVEYWQGRAQQAAGSPAAAESYQAFLALKQGDEDPLVADARKRLAVK
jgi:tetratricopeptide (TPR) repeat protein